MGDARRIVLTRQHEANGPWAARLRAADLAVLEMPLIRFAALPAPADFDAAAWDWILFTSPQGVQAFASAGCTTGATRTAALGPGTGAALAAAGLRDDLDLGTRNGAEFATAFTAAASGPGRVLLPGPRRRLAEPRATLEQAGFTVAELPLYETVAVPAAELPADPWTAGDIVFFCSPSTVRAFSAAWDGRPDCVTIGNTTAVTAREAGFTPLVAATPDLAAMVAAAGFGHLPSTLDAES